MEAAAEPVVLAARAQALEETAEARRPGAGPAVLVLHQHPAGSSELKSYVRDYGLSVSHLCVILTPESRKKPECHPALEDSLLAWYGGRRPRPGDTAPPEPGRGDAARNLRRGGCGGGQCDFTLRMGAPLIPAVNETTSLSFPSLCPRDGA